MAVPRLKLIAGGGALALALAWWAGGAPARAQVEALPPGAAAIMLDAVRVGSGNAPNYGMTGLSGANRELLAYVERARARAAGSLVALGAITAIAQYPESAAVIVRAAVELAPESRNAVVAEIGRAYPGFSREIYAAAGVTAPAPSVPAAAAAPQPIAPPVPPSPAPPLTVVAAPEAPSVIRESDMPPSHESSLGPDWRVRLAVGPGIRPEFQGASDIDIVPVPLVDVTWAERVFVNWRNGLFEELDDGVGVYAWNLPNLQVALSLRHDPGRDESDSSRLRGLGDVDGSFELAALFRLIVEEHWIFSTRLRRDVSGGHEGTLADFLLGYRDWLAGPTLYDVHLGATWADRDYMKSLFGIGAAQAAASGFPRYAPQGDFRDVFLDGAVAYYLSEHWFVETRSRFSTLTGDAADSPIVQRKFQVTTGILLGYDF